MVFLIKKGLSKEGGGFLILTVFSKVEPLAYQTSHLIK